jgi:hypothetical protein
MGLGTHMRKMRAAIRGRLQGGARRSYVRIVQKETRLTEQMSYF